MAGDDDVAARVERERAFHDERFQDDPRAATGKYYRAAEAARQAYDRAVLDDVAGIDLLEYGCGASCVALDAARQGARAHAIDISSVAVAQAQDAADDAGVVVDLSVMDAHHLDFEAGSFDRVVGSGILHHLDLEQAISEVSRVLRDDGEAVFYEPLGQNPFINAYRRLTPSMRSEDEAPLVESDLRALASHFEQADLDRFALTTLLSVPLGGSAGPRARTTLERVDAGLFRRLPATRRWAWIVVLRLRRPRR